MGYRERAVEQGVLGQEANPGEDQVRVFNGDHPKTETIASPITEPPMPIPSHHISRRKRGPTRGRCRASYVVGGTGANSMQLDVSYLRVRWRRAAVLVTAIVVIAGAGFIYVSANTPAPLPNTFGVPERGKTLAVVHLGGKTAYFPGVVCESTDPELISVSLGVRDDPVSFFLASFLGPQTPDRRYVSPLTSLVSGHRPGITFDQQGTGSISVSNDLQAALQGARSSSPVKVGSLSFHGTDRTGASLNGVVTCSLTK